MKGLFWLPLLMLLSLSGCSSYSFFADSEKALKTDGYYDRLDHIAAYYPRGIALNFPGYIIGVEETTRKQVADDTSDIKVDETIYETGYTVRRLIKTLRYKTPFISLIMRYEGQPYGQGNCSLYNLYHNQGSTIVKPCKKLAHDTNVDNYNYDSAFDPVFWSDAVGDHNFMLKYCNSPQPVNVSCISTDSAGNTHDYTPAAKISYIDTSALNKYTMPGTEGGGHSDIYRTEFGRLLWNVLNGRQQ